MDFSKLLDEKCCYNCSYNSNDKTVTPCSTCSRNVKYTDHFKEHAIIKALKVRVKEASNGET